MRAWLAVALSSFVSACSCGGGGPPDGGDSITVVISAPTGTVYTNGTVALTLAVTGSPTAVALLSDGTEVAQVMSPFTGAMLDTTSLTEGSHPLVARATKAGVTADSAALTLVVDRTAPTIVSKWPAAGNAFGGGWLGESIGVVFSEPILASSVTASVLTATFTPPGAAASLSAATLSSDGLTLTSKTTAPPTQLPAQLMFSLGGTLTDRAGNAMAAAMWSEFFPRWSTAANIVSTPTSVGFFPHLAVDSTGAAFVAFTELSSMTIQVRKLSPGKSELLPSIAFTPAGGPSFADVAVDAMGRPVIAYMELIGNTPTVVAKRLEGGAWAALATSVGAGAFPDLAIDSTGNPVVAFTDPGAAARAIHVSKWNGTAWVAAAADLVTLGVGGLGDPSGPSLVLGPQNVPNLAYVEVAAGSGVGNTGPTQVKIAAANGMTGWTPYAGAVNVSPRGAARWPSLGQSSSALFVAWEENDDEQAATVHVKKWDGQAWVKLGRPLDVDLVKAAHWPSLAVDSTGAPIVAWTEDTQPGPRWTQCARFDGTQWQFVGGAQVAGGTALMPSLGLAGDIPVIALSQVSASGQGSNVFVRRYNGTGVANAFGVQAVPAATSCAVGVTPPASLSATQCFDVTMNPPAPVLDLIPFELNSPLWSDGALKRRWIRLPTGTTLGYADVGAWTYPSGTMIVKEFSFNQDPADPSTRRPAETRFLVKRDDAGWEGFSYQWNDTFTDATLLPGASFTKKFWPYVNVGGADAGHSQIYPARTECTQCHANAAGNILGLQAAQLNRAFDYGGVADYELRVFDHLGLFGTSVPSATVDRFVNPTDTSETLEKRVRGYLAANCAQCHRPGGQRPTRDFRWETPFSNTLICDGGSQAEVSPGDAGQSLMYRRVTGLQPPRMPPLATDVVDDVAVGVIAEWINSLTTCQ